MNNPLSTNYDKHLTYSASLSFVSASSVSELESALRSGCARNGSAKSKENPHVKNARTFLRICDPAIGCGGPPLLA